MSDRHEKKSLSLLINFRGDHVVWLLVCVQAHSYKAQSFDQGPNQQKGLKKSPHSPIVQEGQVVKEVFLQDPFKPQILIVQMKMASGGRNNENLTIVVALPTVLTFPTIDRYKS